MMENQPTNTKNVLLDTSIILEGMSAIESIPKHHNIFITDIVLRELDGNKNTEGVKGYNAREFFRRYNACEFTMQLSMPFSNQVLGHTDKLSMALFPSGMKIYALSRKWYHAKDINDSKIIEIAKDYNLSLMTLDQAQSARAKSEGVGVEIGVKNREPIDILIPIFIFVAIIAFLWSAIAGELGIVILSFLALFVLVFFPEALKYLDSAGNAANDSFVFSKHSDINKVIDLSFDSATIQAYTINGH